MDLKLAGRVALVTGAGGAIGAAVCTRLAAEGTHVVLADLDFPRVQGRAEELKADGYQAVAVELDVSDESSWVAAVQTVEASFGRIAMLANCAGINGVEDVEHEEMAEYQRLIAVNQVGVWLGMKHSIASLRAGGGGSIVNIASVAGVVSGFGGAIAYHAAKGAIRGMSRNAAMRLAPDGIRVNTVHPGPVDSAMLNRDQWEHHIQMTMLKRLAMPEEIADVVVFMGSPCSSYMTGAEVFVDGGWTAQ